MTTERNASDYRARLATEIRSALGEFNDENEPVVALVRELAEKARALESAGQGEAQAVPEPPRYHMTTGHCPNKSAGSRDCGLHNLHCNWPKCDQRIELLNPTPPPSEHPEAQAGGEVADGPCGCQNFCEHHGRELIEVTEDGEEYCHECSADGYSGELCSPMAGSCDMLSPKANEFERSFMCPAHAAENAEFCRESYAEAYTTPPAKVPEGVVRVEVAIVSDLMDALHSFAATAEDEECYTVSSELMSRLAMLGAVYRAKRAGWYYLTDFGRMLLAAAPAPKEGV